MARILLCITILIAGFSLPGCSSNKGQVEAPKVTVPYAPSAQKDGKTGKAD
jgi:hypothetical protein